VACVREGRLAWRVLVEKGTTFKVGGYCSNVVYRTRRRWCDVD